MEADEKSKSFCISGKLNSGKKKKDYVRHLEKAGCALVDKGTADLDYLVLADPASTSSKAQKARKLNVSVISEKSSSSRR